MTTVAHQIRTLSDIDRSHWEPLWLRYLRFYESSLDDEVSGGSDGIVNYTIKAARSRP